MIDTELIKQRISCIDYCQSKGLPISKAGDRCVSPIRSGARNKTSFVCYADFWYDFSAGQGGDVIDLCALAEYGGDKGSAIRALAKRAGIEDDGSTAGWVEYTQNLNAKIAKWHADLSPEYRKYCNDRGITDETINEIRIGQTENGRLAIPYYKNGYVAYYITRAMPGSGNPESKYMKAHKDGLCENVIWGLQSLERKGDTLVVAEGMFDILSFYQEGFPCISAITGHFPKAQIPSVLSICRNFKRVFLVYDNDLISHAGEKFTVKMAKLLFANRIPFVVGKVPNGFKDVSDYYQARGNLQTLVDDATDGVTALCSMLTDREDFEQTVRRACRYMTKSDVALLFTEIQRVSSFPYDWLKILAKECSSAPSEDSIVKELADRRKIKYHRSVGFIEYNGKYWERITDETVMSYIGDILGVYRTGTRLSSILKVFKSEVNSEELLDLNRHAVMNFINGTLELEPSILLREHREDDYCTYCLPYAYDPTAHSQLWEDYLGTVTDFDDKKIALLQEYAGYCLFTDCSMQKALNLIGEGSNGKSIYINVINDIFSKPNTSNVSMSDLMKDFHSIDLKYSMVNFASETRSDVTGAEEKFKKVIVGETVRDSYKGKDVTDFAPRAKWILSSNNFMVSKTDQSDGWVRRFCFCEFKLRFCDEPTLPHERKADHSLERRLRTNEELTAIFNWVLCGYQTLKATMKFTEPDDQHITTRDFIEVTNPIVVFVKEFDIDACTDHCITNADLYRNYTAWCDESRHKALAKTSFEKRIPKAFREYRGDLEPFKTSKFRGWRKVDTVIAGQLI
ncbi:MAG: toprim domain-containing protein [Clostridia bacterium]|nr:toprim domain-containing protein [Clostridia bacterium]